MLHAILISQPLQLLLLVTKPLMQMFFSFYYNFFASYDSCQEARKSTAIKNSENFGKKARCLAVMSDGIL